jgi:GAF domain-containing protein
MIELVLMMGTCLVVGFALSLVGRARECHDLGLLLNVIAKMHSKHLRDEGPHEIFGFVLENLLMLTGSKYGFIGDIVRCDNQPPFLKTWAITNIAWSEETLNYYEEGYKSGLEFKNLETLFGAAIVTEEMVLANDPSNDDRSGGTLPEKHPPLRCFLGLPIMHGGEMIGLVGVANRPGGYNEALVEYLAPLMSSLGSLLVSNRRNLGCC